MKHFDPEYWLDLWQRAGGGWAASHLLRPAGQNTDLDALAAELDADRREALRRHLESTLH